MTAILSCENLCLNYGAAQVLEDVSIDLHAGEITMIVGPNACGKSSLLRCLSRLQVPSGGRVLLEGAPIAGLRPRAVARRLAYLPQNTIAPDGMRVAELVLRGRTPHQSPLQQYAQADHDMVQTVLEQVGLAQQGDRLLGDLSGGQLQRAWIAMILAQDTDILLLDEPTTYLDMAHQREVLELVRALQARRGLTVAMVLHDINLAARYGDRILALRDRRLVVSGTPDEVVTESHIDRIYGLECSVLRDPFHNRPHIILK